MAINLNKYRESLTSAWKDVLNDKTDTDWAVFGYDGQTNDLKAISRGSGGIEEMIEDLNSGKIMYAFLKINDPKTSLPKCILINWQGEGANTVRKGICANHLRDVANFFTGAHVSINARNEEEVEPQLIIDKVAKSGSAYSFKAPRSDNSNPTPNIGSNYQKVNPIKEINARERDQFWLKEEQEEKNRIEEEKNRKALEKAKLEEELKRREIIEAAERETKSSVRNNNIAQIRQAEAERTVAVAQTAQATEENVPRVNQSDLLRQERNKEAQELIAQRTINARSIFEQNTSAGQMKRTTPEKPARNSLNKLNNAQNNKAVAAADIQDVAQIEIAKVDEQQTSDDESDQFSTIKRSPKDLTNQQEAKKVEMAALPQQAESFTHPITEQQFVDEVIYQDFNEDPGLQARALYDYQAADDTEITFDPGDVITNIDQVDEGWWQGLGPDGAYGLFPANYVELMN